MFSFRIVDHYVSVTILICDSKIKEYYKRDST